MVSKKVIDMIVDEKRLLNMNFSKKLGAANLTGTPTWSVSTGGPTTSSPTTSGKRAQALFVGTSINPGRYRVECTVTDDSSPAQTLVGIGILRVN